MLENITYSQNNVMIYELKSFWNKSIFDEPFVDKNLN
jgi:hypothetical protein